MTEDKAAVVRLRARDAATAVERLAAALAAEGTDDPVAVEYLVRLSEASARVDEYTGTDLSPRSRGAAEVLRAAADDLYGDDRARGLHADPLSVASWLHERADRIEAAEGGDRWVDSQVVRVVAEVLAEHRPEHTSAAFKPETTFFCRRCSERARDWVLWTPEHVVDRLRKRLDGADVEGGRNG